MMKDVLHGILSELHHILSIATVEELRTASRLPSVSENMKTALDALARERAVNHDARIPKAPISRPKKESRILQDSVSSQRELALSGLSNDEEKRIYRVLMASPRFPDKATLRSLINETDIPVQIGDKDSKDRTARKVARAIHGAPENRKASLLSTLMEGQDKQTQGWIEVIKGSR